MGTGALARPSRAQLGSCRWSLQFRIGEKRSPRATHTQGPGFCLVIKPRQPLCRYLQVLLGPILEFFSALFRAESISSPQTGCGIRIPSHRLSFHKQDQLSSFLLLENLFLWPPLTAMTFPFSAVLQVTVPVHLFRPAISSAQNVRKILPPPCTLYHRSPRNSNPLYLR